jgi:hypothetical protein
MLKAIVSYSKKIPAEAEYSSQGYSLSLETEIPEASPDAIQAKLHTTFELVKTSVEQELANGNSRGTVKHDVPENMLDSVPSHVGKASNKQIKYLTDLARQQDIGVSELNARCEDLFKVGSIYDLTKRDASKLLDSLKNGNTQMAA